MVTATNFRYYKRKSFFGYNKMGSTNSIQGFSDKLKKAVCWISETVQEHPEKSRKEVITEAELRFDLTPRECEFLNSNFKDLITKNCSS